ncbi:MAG: T9SS type A sorting domain-containing protein, partial [FCB group bacterium]
GIYDYINKSFIKTYSFPKTLVQQIYLSPKGNYFMCYANDSYLRRFDDSIISNVEENLTKNDISISPNPVSNEAKISFNINERSKVQVCVYSLLGELIANILDEETEAGSHSVNFNTSNLSQGMYIVTFKSAGEIRSCKMAVIK